MWEFFCDRQCEKRGDMANHAIRVAFESLFETFVHNFMISGMSLSFERTLLELEETQRSPTHQAGAARYSAHSD